MAYKNSPVIVFIIKLFESNFPHSSLSFRPLACAINGVNPYEIPNPITKTIINKLFTNDTAANCVIPANCPTITPSAMCVAMCPI